MPQEATILDHDTIDLIVFRTLGVVNAELLKETYDLNPDIANYGTTLPAGIKVTVPDLPSTTVVEGSIKLYD